MPDRTNDGKIVVVDKRTGQKHRIMPHILNHTDNYKIPPKARAAAASQSAGSAGASDTGQPETDQADTNQSDGATTAKAGAKPKNQTKKED